MFLHSEFLYLFKMIGKLCATHDGGGDGFVNVTQSWNILRDFGDLHYYFFHIVIYKFCANKLKKKLKKKRMKKKWELQ